MEKNLRRNIAFVNYCPYKEGRPILVSLNGSLYIHLFTFVVLIAYYMQTELNVLKIR